MDYYRFPAPFTRVACFYFFEKLLTLYGDDLGHGGLAMLADCSGMGWANFDLSMEKYFSEFMSDALPIKIGCMAMAKQPMLFTAMMGAEQFLKKPKLLISIVALIKPFLSTKMKQRLLVVGTDYVSLVCRSPRLTGCSTEQTEAVFRRFVASRRVWRHVGSARFAVGA